MHIDVLGCYGNVAGNHRTTGFLINNSILLDAGTVTEVLDDEQLKQIKHVVISHTHIDHLKGIFPLVDQLAMMGDYSVELVSVGQVIQIMSENLFNNLIWPDFTVIPSEKNAIISPRTIEIERVARIGEISVKPVMMTHTVFTVGYVVKQGGHGFMFTADTGPTRRFWEVAKKEKGIEFIIADISFPDRLKKLAVISGHMTPAMLAEQLDRHGLGNMAVYVNHIKPVFLAEILDELKALNRETIVPLAQGSRITL